MERERYLDCIRLRHVFPESKQKPNVIESMSNCDSAENWVLIQFHFSEITWASWDATK
jgi:hypothetical protein